MVQRNWTNEEIKYLKDNYKNMFLSDIGDILNRTFQAVNTRAMMLGLKCPKRSRGRSARSGKDNAQWKGGISKDHSRYKKIQTERYPERIKTRKILHEAIVTKKIIRPDICPICKQKSKRPIEAHHKDYSKPLEVEFACYERCHRKLDKRDGHRKMP